MSASLVGSEMCIRDRELFGPEGEKWAAAHAATTSCHEFAVAMHVLSSLPALLNGAHAEWFPGRKSPVTLVAILVNYAQTRKSQLT
eukprot:7109604-Alexandrium_andersonii.AAC.1